MADFHVVTPFFSVSGQVSPADVVCARAEGFTSIINNRPDGEAPGQPAASDIEAAATREGLAYVHIPVVGRPHPDQAAAMHAAARGPGVKALAFCRTGNRSITAWALGELAAGTTRREELIRLAAAAGYDLSGVLPA